MPDQKRSPTPRDQRATKPQGRTLSWRGVLGGWQVVVGPQREPRKN